MGAHPIGLRILLQSGNKVFGRRPSPAQLQHGKGITSSATLRPCLCFRCLCRAYRPHRSARAAPLRSAAHTPPSVARHLSPPIPRIFFVRLRSAPAGFPRCSLSPPALRHSATLRPPRLRASAPRVTPRLSSTEPDSPPLRLQRAIKLPRSPLN